MVSTKKLINMAKRWQNFAAKQRKRISFPRNGSEAKGYTDQARFVLPLTYLENEAVAQLLNMSEEEFGLPSGGHITLPCDLGFMNYIIYQEKCSCWRSSEGVAPLNSFVLQFNFNFSLHQKN
ncbi:auxin-responsive protein SAUR68-like [Solanum lycopersicum]|uniref:auxin-responsive protein SAUR68-like n=1 Tax=Solanum lycopersicum TaxID=4081 RepID=UPI0037489843